MRDLIIIGNGFDLAHDLKTSYNDFIVWYLNKAIKKVSNGEVHEDALLTIEGNGYTYAFRDVRSVQEFHKFINGYNTIKIKYRTSFSREILNEESNYFWMDLEKQYYYQLIRLYKGIEGREYDYDLKVAKGIEILNSAFSRLRIELIEYLGIIERGGKIKRDSILNLINGIVTADSLVLNFNYTSTPELYFRLEQLVYIHGDLNYEDNPIIFGYGDEMDQYYQKIEQADIDDFLLNIKSFGYFRNDNYQRLSYFLGEGDFNVHLMGHSCGLSDRTLLNTIFEHKSCIGIKIYYHQRSEKETDHDHFEKTMAISRHFKPENKAIMRNKIVNLKNSIPLV